MRDIAFGKNGPWFSKVVVMIQARDVGSIKGVTNNLTHRILHEP